MAISISSSFDSGNIRVVSVADNVATLEICKDSKANFYQWFHFRVGGCVGETVTLKIVNCGSSAYVGGWNGYRARYSYDRNDWRQEARTTYLDGVLTIEHHCTSNVVWFAYFAPYSMERHHDLIARMQNSDGVTHAELGFSVEKQAIDCFEIGIGPKQIWLYGRQHPGESMAQWWLEGALEMLSDSTDPCAVGLRTAATFHIVPNMNPDGSRAGHLRTNGAGMDLNRQWAAPSLENSPEVFCVLREMDRTGVHFAIDVHGDETIPANFVAGFEGIPNWDDKQGKLFERFRDELTVRTHDFQNRLGYPPSAPGQANLAISSNQVANRFGCVAMTLEMPFKDHDSQPVPTHGWNPIRCKALARDSLAVLANMIDALG
jgi:murein tripeptide amidase MpaA